MFLLYDIIVLSNAIITYLFFSSQFPFPLLCEEFYSRFFCESFPPSLSFSTFILECAFSLPAIVKSNVPLSDVGAKRTEL